MTAPSSISDPNLEVLDLRHFASDDLRALLDEESLLWSQLLYWDYRGSADMILRYLDAKILPGYAALENGVLTGYCFFVYEGNKGVIGDLFASAPGTLKASLAEHRLLDHTIATLQQSPGIHRIEAQLLLHPAGAVARPFADHGFRRHPRLFMLLSLDGSGPARQTKGARAGNFAGRSESTLWRGAFREFGRGARAKGLNKIEGVVLPPDIELRCWSEHDYQTAAALITSAYRGHVDADINDQYRSVAGSLRFLNNIIRFPGCGHFDQGSSFIAVDRTTRAAVGLVLCSRVCEDVGHVTQICVVPEQRGRGVGEAMLAAAAQALRNRHFRALTLTVTETNTVAVNIYKHLGYVVHRVFDAFVWEG